MALEDELDLNTGLVVDRAEREHGIDPRAGLVVGNRIRAVLLERRYFHLDGVRAAEHFARFQPSRTQPEASDGQHFDLLNIGDPLGPMLDVGNTSNTCSTAAATTVVTVTVMKLLSFHLLPRACGGVEC